jgi:hypothetical protein
MYESVDWIELAQEKDQWRVLVKTAMNHKHSVILRCQPAQSLALVDPELAVSSCD